MKNHFRWNPYADQPHNVAPKSERLRHHFCHLPSYLEMIGSNIRSLPKVLGRYRRLRKDMYRNPVTLGDPFGLAFTPAADHEKEIIDHFKDLEIRQAILRIPSWERKRLPYYEDWLDLMTKQGIEVTIALLQRREDVLYPEQWKDFLEETFSRMGKNCRLYEIGHAWNRTKWGVWDYREYLRLAEPAVEISRKYNVSLAGPAVIDFEFHLYPPVMRTVPFEIISSLLYVDRMGAPENRQFGWDTARKTALLRAIIDSCGGRDRELWITEVNWPLEGTGRYSPASGRPNVSEKSQADFLTRYFILCLAGGMIRKIFWWQLAAPGYGLIDTRGDQWRKRPAYFAYRNLVRRLKNSTYTGVEPIPGIHGLNFQKEKERFTVYWTSGGPVDFSIPKGIIRMTDRDGTSLPLEERGFRISGSPVFGNCSDT